METIIKELKRRQKCGENSLDLVAEFMSKAQYTLLEDTMKRVSYKKMASILVSIVRRLSLY